MIDLANIQGFVVRGYRLPFAAYVYLRIDDAAKARAALADFLPQVITAEHWTDKPESGINVAVSFAGLKAMGVGERTLDAFPAEFKAGMAARAQVLGDIGDSAPGNWEEPFRTGEAHVLVMVSAKSQEALEARNGRVREAVERVGGATVVGAQLGGALEGGREHFGYADGFAQPSIEGSGFDPPARRGRAAEGRTAGGRSAPASSCSATRTSRIRSRRRRRRTTSASTAPTSSTASCARTWRASGALLREAAGEYPGGEELLAAKIVGRWRDGTPLDVSPDRPDAALVTDPARNNAFDYAGDDGRPALPRRRARAAHEPASQPAVRRQAREPPPDHAPRHHLRRPAARGRRGRRAGPRRGLHVPAGELARGFEFVQSQWANGGNAFRLGRGPGRDPRPA